MKDKESKMTLLYGAPVIKPERLQNPKQAETEFSALYAGPDFFARNTDKNDDRQTEEDYENLMDMVEVYAGPEAFMDFDDPDVERKTYPNHYRKQNVYVNQSEDETVWICPVCGSAVSMAFRFCPECGKKR